jgi:glycogen synthase
VTRAEAFGLVVLEGMAAGCVPVVSDLPGVRDLVSRTGIVVPARDVAALRHALLGLAADRTRLERLCRSARRRAEGLGWDACVERYEGVLIEAVEEGRATRSHEVDRVNGATAPVNLWRTVPYAPDNLNAGRNGRRST